MRGFKLLLLMVSLTVLAGCEVRMAPSDYWAKLFRTQTDSNYYKEKAESLTEHLAKDSREYEINKVAVMDLTDEGGKAPILGEYLSSRIIEAITTKKLFRVAQKGEVNATLTDLNLQPAFLYTTHELKTLGDALNSQAILTGRITDLGTNIDVHLTLTDVATGEVIASSTENLNRTKFAVEMLRHY